MSQLTTQESSAPESTEDSEKTELPENQSTESTTEENPQAANEESEKPDSQPSSSNIVPVRCQPKPTDEQLRRRKEIVKAIRSLNVEKVADELGVGKLLLQDILHSICRPEYDPRNNVNRPVFRSGIIKLEDLANEMELEAQVVNVVDFGVFVDIGLGTSCLVHVSQLANHFIRDPHRFYAVGDSLKVWVTEVDTERRRVKLTAVQPKSLRPKRKTDRKPERNFGKSKFKKSGKQHSHQQNKHKRKAKPKPVKPITDDMLTGAEPMRSFSDLAQFFDKKPEKKNGEDA